MALTLSLVIPTYQAAAVLGQTLDELGREIEPGDEIVVADGGSSDATAAIAESGGARTVFSTCGRGMQLAAGVAASTGTWLLTLHADTRLRPGWRAAVAAYIADPRNRDRAAYFRLELDDPSPAARRVERLAGWRARALGLPYGDQGLLLRRELCQRIGGYCPMAMMEDVDIVRRLGRARLVALPGAALTSAARYRRDGWWLRPARNITCLVLYFVGAPIPWITRVYGR